MKRGECQVLSGEWREKPSPPSPRAARYFFLRAFASLREINPNFAAALPHWAFCGELLVG
jgi:hypothetical protein